MDSIRNALAPMMDSLWIELGLQDLSETDKQNLSDKIFDHLSEAITIRLLEVLPEAEVSKEKLQQMTDEDLDELLKTHAVDFIGIVFEEAGLLREDLKNAAAYAEGYLHAKKEEKGDA